MMRSRHFAIHSVVTLVVACGSNQVWSQTVDFSGYADFRVVDRASEKAWTDGGLGKVQYGGTGVAPKFGGAVGEISSQLAAELNAHAAIKFDPLVHAWPELLDAYVRYRPVSTSPYRFAVKAGAFFPPISLENDGIGWTSYWTLSPSAINTWVGEELRTIGSEGTFQWRTESIGTFEAVSAVYMANEGAGTILQNRGWALGDTDMGLGGTLRNINGAKIHRMDPFLELDGRPGWYGGISWQDEDWGQIRLLRYNNQASPSSGRGPHGWNTDFWSLGLKTQIDEIEIIAQGMSGRTIVQPLLEKYPTDFQSAFLLFGREIGDWNGEWRAAIRGDWFRTNNQYDDYHIMFSEHGRSATMAVTWKPKDWLRVSLEEMHIQSTRGDLSTHGKNPEQTADQLQLSFRFIY
jgi:hypothetical protein